MNTEVAIPEEPNESEEVVTHSMQFLATVKSMKNEGKTEKDIAKSFKLSVSQFRKALDDARRGVYEASEEVKVLEIELPLYMRRGTHPLLIGNAVVTTTLGKGTTVVASLDSDEGIEMGTLLTSGLVSGLSLGGIMSRETIDKLENR